MAIFTYYIYITHGEYQDIEKKTEQQKVFNELNELLKALEKEQFFSVVHLVKKNSYTLEKVKQERLKTDILLTQNQQYLKHISLVRQKVDSLDLDYLTILSTYQNKTIQSILTHLEKMADSDSKKNVLMFIRLRDSINLENSFLAFSLLKSQKMDEQDLVFWESILEKRILTNFVTSDGKKISVELNTILDEETFKEIGFEERVQLFLDSKEGRYSLSLNNWLDVVNEKVKKIDEAENILVFNDKLTLDNQLLRKDREFYKYILVLLLFFIIFLSLLFILHVLENIDRDKSFLRNTLREIEIDVDEKRRRELEALIHRNDSIEIYKFLANAIKEPSRAKDLFLANMSHEIRTPLNGIVGFTKELQTTELNEEQREMLGIIEESSNHLIHIVNDILDFSKLKAGKVELESIPFNPIAKVEASIDTFVAKAREKDIELKVYIDPNIPTELLGDPTKILQILNNLISNAIKFTVNGGVVEVSFIQLTNSANEVEVKFLVKDSGIGIESTEKEKIFDEFSQADASTNRKYGGTGLGLSISSQFVKHMGGKLEIESEIGEGSSFYFTLTLAKTAHSKERAKKNLAHFRVGYIPPTHNRSVDAYLRTYVEYQGAKFQSYDRYDLFSLNKSELPHLLFIDYRCFDKEGQIEQFLDLPLKIVLIVAENREDELGGIRHKIDNILHKPLNFTRTSKALEVLTKVTSKKSKKETTKVPKFNDKKALVAEDNFINQKLMKSILNRFGIEVTVVENGEEALSYRKTEKYDIIFMDIQMPVMGGIESTKKILELETENHENHVPIVALTANALEGDREKYLAVGMDAYLAKPMNLKELEQVLVDFM